MSSLEGELTNQMEVEGSQFEPVLRRKKVYLRI